MPDTRWLRLEAEGEKVVEAIEKIATPPEKPVAPKRSHKKRTP